MEEGNNFFFVCNLSGITATYRRKKLLLFSVCGKERVVWQGQYPIFLQAFRISLKVIYSTAPNAIFDWKHSVRRFNINLIISWCILQFDRNELKSAILDVDARNSLKALLESCKDNIVGFMLDSACFVIKTDISSISPLGWVHVYKNDVGKIECGNRWDIKSLTFVVFMQHFSKKCSRVSIKTRKKSAIKCRCLHEIVVACMDGESNLAGTQDTSEDECSNCQRSFPVVNAISCTECQNRVAYCSKECQVSFAKIANSMQSLLLLSIFVKWWNRH